MVRGLMDRQSHDARHERAATEGQKTGYSTSVPVCDLGINTNQDASDDPSPQAGPRVAAITAAERSASDPLRCLALGSETWHGMNLRPFEKGAMRKKPD